MKLLHSREINQDACIKFLTKYSKCGDGSLVDSILTYEYRSIDTVSNFESWFQSIINYKVKFGKTTYYVTIYETDGLFWVLEPGWFTFTISHWKQIYQFVVNANKGII